MSTDLFFLILQGITIAALALAVIFVFGVVWRVESELDSSYKFLALAVIFLLVSEALAMLDVSTSPAWMALGAQGFKMLFALSFLIGILLMRDIVRKIDGEKKSKRD